MRIVVIGGGPSGLYFALLAKQYFPLANIAVFEQNPRGATYGFGVVLAERGLERLRCAHPQSHAAIMEASYVSRNRIISHPRERFFVEGGGYGGAISRLRLLELLETFCLRSGIDLRHNCRVNLFAELGDADLIVGADGVNSSLRGSRETHFGTSSFHLSNRLAWYGTTQHFPYPLLSFIKSDAGYFVAAAYAYNERLSTFVAECDSATYERSGLSQMNEEQQKEFTERVFAAELQGSALISNHSAYRQLPVVRNRRWSVGNAVLIGDALHSAHPTIGSGTRIAMEDAIALAEALAENPRDIPKALDQFRRQREPQKDKLVIASERSFTWYEDFPQKLDSLEPVDFVFDFFMRTGRMSQERLTEEYPDFMRHYAHRSQLFGRQTAAS